MLILRHLLVRPVRAVLLRRFFLLLPLLCGAIAASAQEPAVGLHYGSDFAMAQYDSFGAWLGRKVLYRITFLEKTSWAAITDAALVEKSKTWVNSYPGRIEVMSVPMFANGDTSGFTSITSGQRDGAFRSIASKIQAAGIASKVIVRLAWEANGDWYSWSYLRNPTGFKAAYRRIVSVMRSAAPGLRFEFNISNLAVRGTGGAKWTDGYPGDDVVNVISMDIYDHWNTWTTMVTGDAGLAEMRNFAKAHNKPEAYTEWACKTTPQGGGDNPGFIRAMSDWMDQRPGGVLYQAYWNTTGGGAGLVYSTTTSVLSNAAGQYKELFGAAPPNTAPTISRVGARTININSSTGAIAFTVGDSQTAASNLRVTANVSDSSLIPLSRVVLGGSGANRTVTVSPVSNKTGWSTIWLKVSDGQMAKVTSFVVQVSATLTYIDIGTPNVAGGQSISNGVISMRASGYDISSVSDECRFGHAAMPGDAELTVEVAKLSTTHAWTKAGLMFRSSTAANSAFVGLFVTPSQGIVLQWRAVNGGASSARTPVSGRPPKWLRLTRSGDSFYAFSSNDGVDWDLVETTGVNLPDTARGGLALVSHSPNTLAYADFDNFDVD
jgi:hypothetical protein